MLDVMRIAARNLMRYKRRTVLTSLLITVGLIAILLFVAVAGSFKEMMVGQFTDSMVGHAQVHRRGYLGAMESLPVDRNMRPRMLVKLYEVLDKTPEIEAWSPRFKFMAMLSNFASTTSIRLNGVYPERETATVPLLPGRILEGGEAQPLVKPGHIQIPELLAKPMQLKVGDTVVLVATNREGSVNGQTFVISGILETMSGPGGRDGYIHIDDARELLRVPEQEVDKEVLAGHGLVELKEEEPVQQGLLKPSPAEVASEPEKERSYMPETRDLFLSKGWGTPSEVSEIAIRLKDPDTLPATLAALEGAVADLKNKKGLTIFHLHDWTRFVPFSKIAMMIDRMTMFIYIIVVLVVLFSIMNVMIMAVYERIREIGTISAIGTRPGKILALFVGEGLLLGLLGTAVGVVISVILIAIANARGIPYAFGRQDNLLIVPSIAPSEVIFISLLTIGVAVLASLQPAWKASRIDPITALRHV